MRKKKILVVMLIILSVVICSCAKRYYSDYPGKVTKGYNKAPKDLKR